MNILLASIPFHAQINVIISVHPNHDYENTLLALSTSVDTILRYNGISK